MTFDRVLAAKRDTRRAGPPDRRGCRGWRRSRTAAPAHRARDVEEPGRLRCSNAFPRPTGRCEWAHRRM